MTAQSPPSPIFISVLERRDLAKAGLSERYYLVGREAGASHIDTLDAYQRNISLWAYAADRKNGYTHDEALARYNVVQPRVGRPPKSEQGTEVAS